MNNRFFVSFLTVGCFLSFTSQAQTSRQDSLTGFNEQAFINSSVSRGVSGAEMKSELTIAKKEHIYNAYYKPSINLAAAPSLPNITVVQPACTNMDFETGTFFGWDLSKGYITNALTMQGCCSTLGAPESAIINTGTTMTDPIVPMINLTSPLGGSYIARINDSGTGAVANRISQTFSVTTSNSTFQLAFAAVLNSVGNHCCNEQPNINITLLDSANNVLACPFFSFSAPSGCCPNSDPLWVSFGQGHYRNWTLRTIDLQRYIGTAITVQITVSDCTQSGHYGYAYFDMKCIPLEVTSNGNAYNIASQDSVYISTCGSTSALIGVPNGLGPYSWQGPATSTVTGITSNTISTNVAGTYTITMSPPGTCPLPGNPTGSIVRTAILSITPSPSISATAIQPSCSNASGTGQVNVTSGTGPFTYSWTPATSNSSNTTGLVPGNTYTIIVTDNLGCKGTATLGINSFPDAPTFTITPLNGVLTCASPTLTLSALTVTNTTALWAGTGAASVNVTSPGTYSVTLTNTVSVGQCSTTVNVTVTDNSVPPTAAYSVICNANGFDIVANSQPGVALSWLAPTLPNPTPVSNPGTSTALGIYTLTATNLVTGCQKTYTTSTAVPNLSVTTTDSVICSGQVALLHASGASTYSWSPGFAMGDTYSVTPAVTTSYTVTGFFNSCSSAPSVITVSVSTCTGLEDLSSQKEVMVYPNPGSGVFTLLCSSYKGKLDVTIINILGQALKTGHSENAETMILDLSIYSKGVYYLKVQMEDGSKLLKVILE